MSFPSIFRQCCLALLVAGVLAGGAAVPAAAQEAPAGEVVVREAAGAFEAGDARGVLQHAAERVDLALLSAGALHSRAQALYVVQEFFRAYPPERVLFASDSAREGHRFTTGQYWYPQAEQPLRVYLRFQQKGGRWELREIRAER